MNNLGKSLLVASFAIGAANATGSTNKTFFSGRPVGVNLAMEGTTWHNEINTPTDLEDHFDSSLQISGFYQESTNHTEFGKYFGFSDKNKLVVAAVGSTTDVDHRHLIHDQAGSLISGGGSGNSVKFTGSLDLDYVHEAAGIRLDYQQDLDHFYEGLYLKVRAPIVWQRSGLRLNLTNSVTATVAAHGATGPDDTTTVSLLDYFSGNITQTDEIPSGSDNVAQGALKFAKIDGPKDSYGIADIDVLAGWSFKETNNSHAGINFGFTIPTSPTPSGEYLGESRYGNNGHLAVGGGFDAKMLLWANESSNLKIDTALDWRFLFRQREFRTLGLKNKDWSQYFLVGRTNGYTLEPLANILTQEVLVHPGNQVDARVALAYNNNNFRFDLGYNIYAKEGENVVNDAECFPDVDSLIGIPANDWSDVTLGTADLAREEHNIGATTASQTASPFLDNLDIDTSVAETPSIVTHKVYGGIGYMIDSETPVMLGLGGSYEAASSQIAHENWAIWAKLGLTF